MRAFRIFPASIVQYLYLSKSNLLSHLHVLPSLYEARAPHLRTSKFLRRIMTLSTAICMSKLINRRGPEFLGTGPGHPSVLHLAIAATLLWSFVNRDGYIYTTYRSRTAKTQTVRDELFELL